MSEQRPRVLVVEDDPRQLELRTLILEHAGYSVVGAANPSDALRLAAGCRVVVMDLCLPAESDGLRLIRELGGAARIVVLTGRPVEPSLPVAAVLMKPSPSRALLEIVARLAA